MTYAHDAHCNTVHEAGPDPCPPPFEGDLFLGPGSRLNKAAQEVIDAHQGAIHVTSSRGPGTSPTAEDVKAALVATDVANGIDMVNHPPHYNKHPSGIACIEIKRMLSSNVGDATKYVWRSDLKNGREDIDKARWYLEDAIEHADPIMLARNVNELRRLLALVVETETDPHKSEFFKAIADRDLLRALEVVREMLTEV